MKKLILNIFVAGILISASLYPKWVNTPEKLSFWLIKNFTYQAEEEGEDYWKLPEETIKDKGGDCDDFSFLVDKILSDLGYETKVIAIYLKKDDKITGHAICLIKIGNKYTHFSNQHYFSTKYSTIKELLNKNYLTWEGYYTIYQDGRRVNYIKK